MKPYVPPLGKARVAIASSVTAMPPRAENVAAAFGGVLAEPIHALSAFPAVDLAAMDGYAVAGEGPWRVRRDVHSAGTSNGDPLGPGWAVKIATGAHVPDGADTVVRDEYVYYVGPSTAPFINRTERWPHRDDVRRKGECWYEGALLAPAGARVTAAVVSTALSAGVDEVVARGPLRARVLLTGDEIRAECPSPGFTRDTIGPILPTVLGQMDVDCVGVATVTDRPGQLTQALAEATDVELVIVVGSTGRGAADHLRQSLAALSAATVVDGIAMRPGGSQLTAGLPDGRVMLGLPGNPLAAVASLLATGPVLVDALTGRRDRVPLFGIIDDLTVLREYTRLLPVAQRSNGRWTVSKPGSTAHLAGLIGADALAVVHPGHEFDTHVELLALRT